MKLELKHLVAYLPYDLRAIYLDEFNSMITSNLVGVKNKKAGNVAIFKKEDNFQEEDCAIVLVKPILRPLSDLSKEIKINGDDFIPAEVIFWETALAQRCNNSEFNKLSYLWADKDLFISRNMSIEKLILPFGFKRIIIPHWIVKLLLEWHFDIYGLIDAGLAVDINCL